MDLTLEARKRSINYSFTGLFTYIQQAWDFPVQRTKLTLSPAEQQYLLKLRTSLIWAGGGDLLQGVECALSNHDRRGKKSPSCDRGIQKIDSQIIFK